MRKEISSVSSVQDVITEFTEADSAIRTVFSKVDPLLVVSLIFDKKANKKDIYTLDLVLKPGQDTQHIRQDVLDRTGTAPGFYLNGTKMIVTHTLDLDFLKWINDQAGVVSIKGSKYGAGGSTDF